MLNQSSPDFLLCLPELQLYPIPNFKVVYVQHHYPVTHLCIDFVTHRQQVFISTKKLLSFDHSDCVNYSTKTRFL